MKKYFIAVISAALISGPIAGYFILQEEEEISQFYEFCLDYDDKSSCGIGSIQFNGKSAKEINPDFYDDKYAFWILDTVHSTDCSRIESAMKLVIEDKPLYDYFDIKLDVCRFEVENGKRKEYLNIHSDPYQYEIPYPDVYPDGTVFVAPKEMA